MLSQIELAFLRTVKAACQQGDVEKVATFMRDSSFGNVLHNALITASEEGQLEVVKILLNDKRVVYKNLYAAFDYACAHNRVEVVKLLLPKVKPEDYDNAAIIEAANYNAVEVVRVLLADSRVNPGAKTSEALLRAAMNGHIEVVKALLESPEVNPLESCALTFAASNGYPEIVKILLRDPRVKGKYNQAEVLDCAFQSDNGNVIKVLLKELRIDPREDLNDLLLLACESGKVNTLKVLLADPRTNPAVDGNFALRLAATNGHVDVVKVLLADPRVSPGAVNDFAIRMASKEVHLHVVQALLANPHVNPAAEDNSAIKEAVQALKIYEKGYTARRMLISLFSDYRVNYKTDRLPFDFFIKLVMSIKKFNFLCSINFFNSETNEKAQKTINERIRGLCFLLLINAVKRDEKVKFLTAPDESLPRARFRNT